MISIQTNVSSMAAQENLRTTTDFQSRTIARLTSGYRINQSGDDAAGLAVANKFRSDVSELTQGVRNANDGLSTLQVIDGGLSNVSKILDRLKTLATQSASSTFEGNRALLNTEYQDLTTEITRQAGAIGLGTGATAGRYNRNLSVYVGGAQQGTPTVSVDLAGAGSKVDAAGLGLSTTSIASNDFHVTTGAAFSTVAGGPETLAFTSGGSTVTVSLAIGVATAGAAITQINTDLLAGGISGVTAVLSGTDRIEFKSAETFSLVRAGSSTTTGAFAANATQVVAPGDAGAAIAAISSAVGSLGVVQGKIGSGQNKLQYAISLAQSQITNFSAAESRIRDADVAQEAANLTKASVLSQASMAALSQANSAPQSVLSLLRG